MATTTAMAMPLPARRPQPVSPGAAGVAALERIETGMDKIEKAVRVVTRTSRLHQGRRNSLQLRLKLRECRGEVDSWLAQARRALAAAEGEISTARTAGFAGHGRRQRRLTRLRSRCAQLESEVQRWHKDQAAAEEEISAEISAYEAEELARKYDHQQGFICPICHHASSSADSLARHYAEQHEQELECARSPRESEPATFSRPRFLSASIVSQNENGEGSAGATVTGPAGAVDTVSAPRDAGHADGSSSFDRLHAQLQVEDEVAINEHIVQERALSIERVAKQVVVVRELFTDVARLVNEQQVYIDTIEQNTGAAAQNASAAVQDLRRAHALQPDLFGFG